MNASVAPVEFSEIKGDDYAHDQHGRFRDPLNVVRDSRMGTDEKREILTRWSERRLEFLYKNFRTRDWQRDNMFSQLEQAVAQLDALQAQTS